MLLVLYIIHPLSVIMLWLLFYRRMLVQEACQLCFQKDYVCDVMYGLYSWAVLWMLQEGAW